MADKATKLELSLAQAIDDLGRAVHGNDWTGAEWSTATDVSSLFEGEEKAAYLRSREYQEIKQKEPHKNQTNFVMSLLRKAFLSGVIRPYLKTRPAKEFIDPETWRAGIEVFKKGALLRYDVKTSGGVYKPIMLLASELSALLPRKAGPKSKAEDMLGGFKELLKELQASGEPMPKREGAYYLVLKKLGVKEGQKGYSARTFRRCAWDHKEEIMGQIHNGQIGGLT